MWLFDHRPTTTPSPLLQKSLIDSWSNCLSPYPTVKHMSCQPNLTSKKIFQLGSSFQGTVAHMSAFFGLAHQLLLPCALSRLPLQLQPILNIVPCALPLVTKHDVSWRAIVTKPQTLPADSPITLELTSNSVPLHLSRRAFSRTGGHCGVETPSVHGFLPMKGLLG